MARSSATQLATLLDCKRQTLLNGYSSASLAPSGYARAGKKDRALTLLETYGLKTSQMLIPPDISACSIVLLGQFNPAIFHPVWLQSKEIEDEASSSDGELLTHRDIATFTIAARTYLIRADRFQIETHSIPWVSILDITTKIFSEHLFNTPVSAFGVNRTVHFKLPSVSSRIHLGRTLAPIEPWDDFGRSMDTDDINLTGGLQSLVMRRRTFVNGNTIETNVTIEPSIRVEGHTSVYMHVNTHHALTDLPNGYGSEKAMTLLAERFDPSLQEADAIIDAIMKRGKAQ